MRFAVRSKFVGNLPSLAWASGEKKKYRQLRNVEPFSGNATFFPGMRSSTYNDLTNSNHDFMS